MNAEFRAILIEADAAKARAAWATIAPHLPQPLTDLEALMCLHMARTRADTIDDRKRFYSHRWLLDHGLPSGLPDHLRPSAERMYPRKVDAVGVAVSSSFSEVAAAVSTAMSNAVFDCYANGDRDPLIVRPQMMAARARERRGLMLPREVN